MSEQTERIPEFSDEQRQYFQQQLARQTGKHLILDPEMLTASQRAEQYRAAGDFPGLKADREATHALIAKHGDTGYAQIQLKWQQSERARKADEARVKLEERKRRLGIR